MLIARSSSKHIDCLLDRQRVQTAVCARNDGRLIQLLLHFSLPAAFLAAAAETQQQQAADKKANNVKKN
jgi:hypothetical protein